MRLTLTQRLIKCRREYAKAYKAKKRTADIHKEAVDVMRRLLRRENAEVKRLGTTTSPTLG